MARQHHIDHILRSWPYQPGSVSARRVRAKDGREVLQMRVEMGVLQLETDHRPDGQRPGGAESYYDYLVALAVHEGDAFRLNEEQCAEVDREFVQYYHRRICWLALREYDRAVRDADHNLSFMDFVRECSEDEKWVMSHEQYRPFILYHRTQAAAMGLVEQGLAEEAIEAVTSGIQRMREWFERYADAEQFDTSELVQRLREMQGTIRDRFGVEQTLEEQLAAAVAAENYERAAALRDEIAGRKGPRRRRRRSSS
ncbi:MAG: UvrB/UvrC motif-containing protein [Pirellulales bacterium]|nr:UvrB/UvrC motif-containing protein [Pirellulales bacterium]